MARDSVDELVDFDNRELKRRVMSWLGTIKGIWRIRFEPKRDTRTLRQNSFYWAAIVTPLYDFLRDNRTEGIACKDDVHEMLKRELLKTDVKNGSGVVVGHTTGSTRRIGVGRMSRYMEDCRDLADSRFGVELLKYDADGETPSRRRQAVGAV